MRKLNPVRPVISLTERLMPLLGMRLKPFYGKDDFKWLEELESKSETIRKEFIENTKMADAPNVLDLDKNLTELTTDDGWKAILLYNHLGPTATGASRYPETVKTISSIPNVVSAAFSILKPRKCLPLHRGPYRGILFVHLGIVIPSPPTSITFIVNKEERNWKEGEAFGFEDSFYHEVVNTSDEYRAILLLEVLRTDIPAVLLPLHRWILRRLNRAQAPNSKI